MSLGGLGCHIHNGWKDLSDAELLETDPAASGGGCESSFCHGHAGQAATQIFFSIIPDITGMMPDEQSSSH